LSHSSGFFGFLSLTQWQYFCAAGGLTTPAMWPDAASTKRTGPLNSWVET